MELTKEHQRHIDSLPYETLLGRWRFAPCGDQWFQGQTGIYWKTRMADLCAQPGGHQEHVRASKSIGWG